MEETTEATLLLPDDLLREILRRVPTDPAALIRCTTTCKQWRTVLADLSFLRHHWPENVCHPSSLLGFFEKPYYNNQNNQVPFFFPISPGSVIGARRRTLASFVSRAPQGGILNGAAPLATRGSLLLVYLAGDPRCLAVCDVFTGACDVLPPLECRVSRYVCAILGQEDCCSLPGQQQGRTPMPTGYSIFFKVLAMVIGDNDQDCNLYTFSSSEPRWSQPRKCFDEAWWRDTFGLRILLGTTKRVTVCRGVAYWLGSYSTDQGSSPHYFTYGVNVKTGQIFIIELSIPTNHLAASLSVTVDGRLTVKDHIDRLHTYEDMEETELPDDILCEILLRVPPAALFRCAATCKRWRSVVADPFFLRRHWPENTCHPSSLLGFFDMQLRDNNQECGTFFFPVWTAGSVLGARRRPLASFDVSGAPGGGDILSAPRPLISRGGLLLMHLVGDPLRLAVCDLLTGTCKVLPPLECRVSSYRWAVLTREDCCSLDEQQQQGQTPLTGSSTFFKVLAIVTDSNNQDCNLYTISLSSGFGWSEPRKCFDEFRWRDTYSVRIVPGSTNRVAICRGMAYWLGSYWTDQRSLRRYFTFGVNVKTGQISISELSIPMNQLTLSIYCALMLSVAVDGRLSLLHLQSEGLRLNTWTLGDDATWLLTRVTELKPPKQAVWNHNYLAMLSGEKSGVLFMADVHGRVHMTDPETGVMEDVTKEMFQGKLTIVAVPIEIDWPTLFMSRLVK